MRLGGTLRAFIEKAEAHRTALRDTNGASWTYGNIRTFLESIEPFEELQGRRVGLCIDHRLHAGLCSLGVMDTGCCVPVNPQFSVQEIKAAIETHRIELLVTDQAHLADQLEIPDLPIGKIDIQDHSLYISWNTQPQLFNSETTDPGLVLQTSGSTGEPKTVKLSLRNLEHSVESFIQSLDLSANDVGLNPLPMVHVGGLVDLLLAPLFAGGQIIFTDPKATEQIRSLIHNGELTWIQGPPTLLSSLIQDQKLTSSHRLRFIRSVSAPLSSELHEELEGTLGVPVIEIYGMSETAGVITSNPLPPSKRKIGSVGLPINCELKLGDVGDIWVRGNNVFDGYPPDYRNSPDWDGDWFNTGDIGHTDEDGYLFLTGRLKELINRGGQKVSPKEIDQIVESWPEIKEAAAFGIEHATLGEEVALAYVLEEGDELDPSEIKQRLSQQLALYKCPKVFYRWERLPRNDGGKLQRHLLISHPDVVASSKSALSTNTEQKVGRIWKSLLKVSDISADDDFYELGGDSLSAASLMKSLEREFSISLQALVFYENTTVRSLAQFIDETQRSQGSTSEDTDGILIPKRLRKKLDAFIFAWDGAPSFPGALCKEYPQKNKSGLERLFWCANNKVQFEGMQSAMDGQFQVVGFRTLQRIQKRYFRNYPLLVETYANHIEKIQPEGDYVLGGFCEGGKIMIEVAQLLKKRGKTVRHLILNDYISHAPVDSYVSMVFSTGWKHSPLFLWSNPQLAWQKVFGSNFGVLPWDGEHQSYDAKPFQRALAEFIQSEREEAIISGDKRPPTVQPRCSITPVSKIPRLMSRGKSYSVRFKVTNDGPNTISTEDGVLLHARWTDLERIKDGVAMHTKLPQELKPGESIELDLKIKTLDKKRLYRIQVTMLEEGQPWPLGAERFQQWVAIL